MFRWCPTVAGRFLQQPGVDHAQIDVAVRQRRAQRIARPGLSDTRHGPALGIGQQRIAALQRVTRIEQLQAQRRALQPALLGFKSALQALRNLARELLLDLLLALQPQLHGMAQTLGAARQLQLIAAQLARRPTQALARMV